MIYRHEAKPYNEYTTTELIRAVARQQGNLIAAAATLGVSRATVYSWSRGARRMNEGSRRLCLVVLDRPEDFAEFKKLARRPGRPTFVQAELFERETKNVGRGFGHE